MRTFMILAAGILLLSTTNAQSAGEFGDFFANEAPSALSDDGFSSFSEGTDMDMNAMAESLQDIAPAGGDEEEQAEDFVLDPQTALEDNETDLIIEPATIEATQ